MDNVNGISSIYTVQVKHIQISIDSLSWDKEFYSKCIKNLSEPFALAHVTPYKLDFYVVVKPFHRLFFILRITECQLKTTDLPLEFRQSRWQRRQRLQSSGSTLFRNTSSRISLPRLMKRNHSPSTNVATRAKDNAEFVGQRISEILFQSLFSSSTVSSFNLKLGPLQIQHSYGTYTYVHKG